MGQRSPAPAVCFAEILVGTDVSCGEGHISEGQKTVFVVDLAVFLTKGSGDGVVVLEDKVFAGQGQTAAAVDGHVVAIADGEGHDVIALGGDGVLAEHLQMEWDRAPALDASKPPAPGIIIAQNCATA